MHGNPERAAALAQTATFIALITAGAWVAIPAGPVPITLQTFFVLLSGAVMKRRAVYPVALYLILGAAGLPLFSRGLGGVGVLLLPNGGFLAGFIPAALITGLAYERKARLLRILGLAAATVTIYACGVSWVIISATKSVTELSLLALLIMYVVPYIPGDILKAAGVFLLGERLP